MKILILEDDPQRMAWFVDTMGKNHSLYIASSVEKAKEYFLVEKPFDVIFMDHDLDGRVYVDSLEPNTGWQFARFLSKQKIGITLVFCHSQYKKGADNIKAMLPCTILLPFYLLIFLKEILDK